jgi:CBS domain-containing protein
MKVKSKMTTNVEVVTADASLKEAGRIMKDHDIGVLPVFEGDRLTGIVTDRDLSVRAIAEGKDPNTTKVSEVMTPDVEYCQESEDIEVVARRMERHQLRRLPVLSHDKKLIGMLSLGDLATRGSRRVACEVLEKVSVPA